MVPKIDIYTRIDRAGRSTTWASIMKRAYRISGQFADALLESGLARHNPYVNFHVVPKGDAIVPKDVMELRVTEDAHIRRQCVACHHKPEPMRAEINYCCVCGKPLGEPGLKYDDLFAEVKHLRSVQPDKTTDEIWRGVSQLYCDFYSESGDYTEALENLLDTWNRMLG